MTRLVSSVLLVGLLFGASACPDNPYKASTWTKKLGDPKEGERAVTQLEQLGDPSAIDALGQAWSDQGKPGREPLFAHANGREGEGRQARGAAAPVDRPEAQPVFHSL